MGKIITGANGGFSGKAGSVIGSSWRGINYIKGLHKKSNKQASEAQKLVKEKFLLVKDFVAPLKSVFDMSLRNVGHKHETGYNKAIRLNLKGDQAIFVVDGKPALDFANATLSGGARYVSLGAKMQNAGAGRLRVSWNAEDPGLNLNPNHPDKIGQDGVYVVLFEPTLKQHLVSYNVASREDGELLIDIPLMFIGLEVHGYIFFADKAQKFASKTTYMGVISPV